MKKFFFRFICLAILLYFSACIKQTNPVSEQDDKNLWTQIAEIQGIEYPKMLFINEEVGFVFGHVYYQNTFLQDSIIVSHTINDTTIIIYETKVKITEPEKYSLWKTTDGGKTWNQISGFFKSSIEDIYFVDEYIGYLVTDHESVFKTIDGGDYWFRVFGSKIAFQVRHGNASDISFAYPQEVCFYDQDHGFIYTEGSKNDLYLFTNDGGQSWEFKYIDIRGENFIFPENGNSVGFASNYLSLFKTDDGGLTWNAIADASLSCKYSFIDANRGMFLTNDKIYITDDGGRNFTLLKDLNGDYEWGFIGDIKNKVIYKNSNVSFFLASGKVVRTIDACSTFQDMLAPPICSFDISFPSNHVGYTINQYGVIYKYIAKE